MSKSISLLFIINSFLIVGSLIEEPEFVEVKIEISHLLSNNIGRKGTVLIDGTFNRSLYTFITNTSKETCFNTTIIKDEDSYIIECGIWADKDDDFDIFCNVDENIPSGKYYMNFSQTKPFIYQNYSIVFTQREEKTFEKQNANIPDLYADNQVIIYDKNQDSYELKFKIVSYKEVILLLNFNILDCKQNNDELICYIKKADLEITESSNNTVLPVLYADPNAGLFAFDMIPHIKLIYYNQEKIDIFVGITQLLDNITEKDCTFAYQTNVTDISNVQTIYGLLKLAFEKEGGNEEMFQCYLRKYEANPLLIVCITKEVGTYHLKNITEEIILNEINLKYNFRIQPFQSLENIESKTNVGSQIDWIYPEILDFTKKDTYEILYYIEFPNKLNGFTFNENEGDLDCSKVGDNIKKCSVSKSHFNGKKNGYYFTKHENHLNKKSILYEAAPIKVILTEDKPTSYSRTIVLSLMYFSLAFLIIL